MFQFLDDLFQALQPLLAPVCFAIAWIFVISLSWTLFSAIRDTVARAKRMHDIPCANCQFFTNNYRLKCTLKPSVASTEQAINCSDYFPKTKPFSLSTEDVHY